MGSFGGRIEIQKIFDKILLVIRDMEETIVDWLVSWIRKLLLDTFLTFLKIKCWNVTLPWKVPEKCRIILDVRKEILRERLGNHYLKRFIEDFLIE